MNHAKRIRRLGLAFLGTAVFACSSSTEQRAPSIAETVPAAPPAPDLIEEDHEEWADAEREDTDTLVVALRDVDTNAVIGAVSLSETADGVLVRVDVDNAQPGLHGIHVHRRADCSLGARSAGGHLAPDDNDHGWPASSEHHLGDLGNLLVEPDHRGTLQRVIPNTTLDDFGGDEELIGRALVMHAQYDDGTGTKGHSGAPVACAEIALR